MANGLTEFRNNFFGVRTNRFMVNFAFPTGIATGLDLDVAQTIYCRATQSPPSAIGVIPVMWQGRPVKFSGERVFGDWTLVIYEAAGRKSSHNLKAAFERWVNNMDTRNTHEINYNVTTNWDLYYDDIQANPNRSGKPGQSPGNYSKHVKLINCFPVEVSPLDLSYDAENAFAEFTVTMSFDLWEPVTAASGA
jgi:hypothetical protein